MKNSERQKEISHWKKVINKLEKDADKRGFSTDAERQEKYLAESKIQSLYGK